MAFIYVAVTFVVVAISFSVSFPIEESINSKFSVSDFKDENKNTVLDEIFGIDEDNSDVMIPSVDVDSVADKHVIVKRAPRAGILGTRKCAYNYFRTAQGCLPCHGQISDECDNKGDQMDYSEIYNYVDYED